MKLGIQPIESSTNVLNLAPALIVLAIAKSRTAKVEAQHGKSKTVQRLHGMKHNFVMQRPAKQRVRVSNQGRVRRIPRPRIQQRLQPSGWAFQK